MNAQHILHRSILAAGIATGFAGAPALAGSTEPASGIYGSYEYVDSATGSDCNQTAGNYFNGRLSWPGPGKLGAVWRYQLNGPGGPQVKAVTLPKTPRAGSVTWAGTEKAVTEPGGMTGESTMDATVTYIDTSSFVVVRTVRFGNCTEKFFISLVHD